LGIEVISTDEVIFFRGVGSNHQPVIVLDFYRDLRKGCPLVMTNIAMEAMAHRNRWFTVFTNGWIFHGYVK